jgi:ATP-dependent RNA helicase RhlE
LSSRRADFFKGKSSVTSFHDMTLAPYLIQALDKMKISVPTPVQIQAIPAAINGSDLIAVAQTGSGKTLAFALPVLTMLFNKPEARAFVMAPSREMAQQIHKVFMDLTSELTVDFPLTSCLVIGGIPNAQQISALKKHPRLLVGTPGRMYDHLLNNKLLLQKVEIVVIDEADRMIDIGFAPQLKNIQKTMRGPRQTLMFSASFDQSVEAIAKIFMATEPVILRTTDAEKPVEGLKQKVLFIDKNHKSARLIQELTAMTGGVILFTGSQERTESVGEFLKEHEFSVDLIHGGLTQCHRNRVIREFRQGAFRILVATDLLARGLDIPHVDHVVSFDLPFEPGDFLHRIGRTARAGRAGSALTFITQLDGDMYDAIRPYLKGAQEVTLLRDFSFFGRD